MNALKIRCQCEFRTEDDRCERRCKTKRDENYCLYDDPIDCPLWQFAKFMAKRKTYGK